jgi:AraC-like DNA-binding protein
MVKPGRPGLPAVADCGPSGLEWREAPDCRWPVAQATIAPGGLPSWKKCLGILGEVTGVPLRHVSPERTELDPANEGHAFCREAGRLECVRQGCQSFHVEMRWRAASQGAPAGIASCPSGFSLFAIAVHDGAAGVVEGGPVLACEPEKAMEQLKQRLARLGLISIPASMRELHAGTMRLNQEQFSGMLQLTQAILSHAPAPPPVHNKPEAICRAIQFVQEHLGEPLSIARVAKSACLSKGYFSKLFKQTVGLSFREYLSKVRVIHARKLLGTTNRRIGDIAFESGFESVPYFNRMFKRFTGITPRQMRTGG